MDILFIALQVLFGIIFADLVSGALHYIQDNYDGDNLPLIGTFFLSGTEHHKDPDAFIHNSLWGRSHMPILGATFVLLASLLLFGPVLWVIVACIAFGLMIEIQVHAHKPIDGRPLWVRVGHYTGIMQSPTHHHLHHSRLINYCVITNWCNPPVEWCLGKMTNTKHTKGNKHDRI